MAKGVKRAATYPELMWAGMSGEGIDALRKSANAKTIQDFEDYMRDLPYPYDHTNTVMFWSLDRWDRSNRPVFNLDIQLAWALANTEPPTETFNLMPEIPADGMYLVLPSVFEMESSTGMHKVEGLFITKNYYPLPQNIIAQMSAPPPVNAQGEIPVLTILGVGSDLWAQQGKRSRSSLMMNMMRDDALIHFSLFPGLPIYASGLAPIAAKAGQPIGTLKNTLIGSTELVRTVVNLLYILQNTNRITAVKDPPTGIDPKAKDRTGKRAQESKLMKNESYISHTVWRLSTLDAKKRKEPSAPVETVVGEEQPPRQLRGTIVLGHVHSYWVLDPGDEKVLATRKTITPKTKIEKTLHLITKWVLPYQRGEIPEGFRREVTLKNGMGWDW